MEEYKDITIKRLFEILHISAEHDKVVNCVASPVYKTVCGIPVIERFDYYFTVTKDAEIK